MFLTALSRGSRQVGGELAVHPRTSEPTMEVPLGRLADTLDALIMDTNGWTPGSSTDVDRSWRDQNRNPIRARLLDRPAAETTLEGWRSRSARETAAGGGEVLSFDEARLDGCLWA